MDDGTRAKKVSPPVPWRHLMDACEVGRPGRLILMMLDCLSSSCRWQTAKTPRAEQQKSAAKRWQILHFDSLGLLLDTCIDMLVLEDDVKELLKNRMPNININRPANNNGMQLLPCTKCKF